MGRLTAVASGDGDGSGDGSGDGGYGDGGYDGYGYGSGDGDGGGCGGGGYDSGSGCGGYVLAAAPIAAFKYVNSGGTLPITHGGDRVTVGAGLVLSCEGALSLCVWGLHASPTPEMAARYRKGQLWRVEMWGAIRWGADKLCSQHMRFVEVAE